MDEQLFWACRLQALGLAVKPLPAKKATAKRLAQRIEIVLASSKMTENAKRIAAEMQGCDGVANAVQAIEKLVQH